MKNILVVEQNKSKFAFRIPSKAIRYRANCKWGQFVKGDPGSLQLLEAKEQGFTYGNFVEMSIASLSNKVLTFEPHYPQEPFLEIWGFPIDGEMHSKSCKENSSELVTFLLHRQSMDKIEDVLADIERDADNAWIDAGMPDNMEEFINQKKIELLASSIFRFEFVCEEGKYGPYYWVKCDRKEAESDLAKAALQCSKQLFELKQSGEQQVCSDPRIEENFKQSMMILNGTKQAQLEPVNSKKN